MKRNVYGVTGYPTPDATTERICRTFNIPNSTLALGAFMGALWPLVDEDAWQEYGDMTPAEAAAMMQTILWDVMTADDVCVVAETPYWDTAANVDDTLPAGSETWYGQIVPTPTLLPSDELTFLDNLGIWVIAGFIAYSGLPGAAIAFVPVAKRFVLAFKQHDLGSIVKVLVDFAEIAEIDTHGVTDGILNLNIVMPDDDLPHTLYVMVDEDNPEGNFAQIVRKELSPAQVSNPAFRYDSECDCVQYTPDDGMTWNESAGSDPRHASAFRLPARTGVDRRCEAAANARAWIKNTIDECIAILETGAIIVALANKILELAEIIFGEVGGVLLNLILDVAGVIFDTGSVALAGAFTDAQYDIMLCCLYCNLDLDGQMSAAMLVDFEAQVTHDMITIAAIITNLFASLQGEVGISNAGAIGSETADCSACECVFTYCWDFTIQNYAADGWAVEAPYGQYAAGQGWQTHPGDGLILDLTFPFAAEIQSVQWGGTAFGGTGPYGRAVLYTFGGATIYNSNQSGIGNPYSQDVEHTATVEKLRFNPYGGSDADIYIQNVKVVSSVEISEWAARAC